MNWKEIKNKYPKAYKKFTGDEICEEILHTLDYLNTGLYNIRNLYDFFDEQGIYVFVELDRTTYPKYSPVIYYTSKPERVEDYYREEPSDEWRDKFLYKSRKEAEERAFMRAFEILEGQLK